MKLPKNMVCHLNIPPHGFAELRAGARGRPTVVHYKTDWDHRISFAGDGWQHFLQTKHLQIGQAILITGRTMHTKVELNFFIDIINDLESGSDSDSE
ncbi:hypothetical protein ACQ4PT_001843 [Festuca glaucescens]